MIDRRARPVPLNGAVAYVRAGERSRTVASPAAVVAGRCPTSRRWIGVRCALANVLGILQLAPVVGEYAIAVALADLIIRRPARR
jgi:hypothetical protein